MKKLVKALKIIFVLTCVTGVFSMTQKQQVLAVNTSEFENNEDYYYDLCSTSGLSDKDKEVCKEFRSYLADKQEALENQLKDLESNIKTLKANIANEGKKIAEYNNRIEALDKQIVAIENSIVKIEGNIELLNAQIIEREKYIEQLNGQIKSSMVVTQAGNRTNMYVKFIMGASSFVDLIRRISAINDLTSYCYDKMQDLEREKGLLQLDVTELQNQKDALTEKQQELETTRATLEKLKALTQELIDEFLRQEAELEEKWESMDEDYSDLDEALKNIDSALKSITPSKSFGQFVKNTRFLITSSGFYYTSGGFHAALDIARLGYTTPVYPIANGYVFAAKAGCSATGGYAGNTCNGGRGNHVFIIVEVEGKYYTVYYEHLSEVYVNVGDVVYKGQTVLGLTGNSGNSTGPHLHFAIYYQGTTKETNIEKIIANYKKYGIRFGLAYNISGSCEARNWKAPCFEDVSEIYGYYRPNWYYVGN